MITYKHSLVVILTITAMMYIGGCAEKSRQAANDPTQKVLARVNGTPITAEDLAFRLQAGHGTPASERQKALDDVIAEVLMYEQGVKVGFDKDPSYRQEIAKYERQLTSARRLEMVRRVLNNQSATKVNVTPQDAKEYYDKNTDKIATELHLEYIKFDTRQEAEDALKKVRGGTPSFESLARSTMGGTAVGGREPWDLGFLKWQQIPIDFADPLYKLKPGEVSDILGSQQAGFQIFRKIESRKGPTVEFGAVSGAVTNRLRDLKMLEAYYRYVDDLKKDAKIVKF